MLVKRTNMVEANPCWVGDIISFNLNDDDEEVEAMAVKQEEDGMVFLLVDCLKQEECMNEEDTNHGGYEASDLRVKLNGKILERFPAEIREQMIPFENGDMLRLPTEKEIFGVNEYGETEDESVEQFAPMKLRRNRIAFEGHNGNWQWYWLQNKSKRYATFFAFVHDYGFAYYYGASASFGVRPAFKIKNQ